MLQNLSCLSFLYFVGKLWFGVNPKDNPKLIALLRKILETLPRGYHIVGERQGRPRIEQKHPCNVPERHKVLFISPSLLLAHGIDVYVSTNVYSVLISTVISRVSVPFKANIHTLDVIAFTGGAPVDYGVHNML